MFRILVGLLALAGTLAPTHAGAQATVKVGVIAPFSGGFAIWGTQFKNAIEVYMAENKGMAGAHKIEVIYRDVGGPNPARAKQLAEELLLRERVQWLAGFVFTPNALAVAPVVTQAKVPTVIFNAATAMITRQSPYFVRTSFTPWQVIYPIAEWAAKGGGIKNAYIAVTDYGPGHDSEEAFKKAFKSSGGTIVGEVRIPLATTDFSPYFQRIADAKPDALFIFAPAGPPSVGMVKTWADRGLKSSGIKLIGTGETQQIDLPSIGDSALGVVTAYHYTEGHDSPKHKKFKADLKRMFPNDPVPNLASVGAYDGMHVIFEVTKKLGGKIDGAKAIQAAKGMKWESPRGPVAIDEERDIVQNVYVRRVEKVGGELTNVTVHTVPNVKDPWKEINPK